MKHPMLVLVLAGTSLIADPGPASTSATPFSELDTGLPDDENRKEFYFDSASVVSNTTLADNGRNTHTARTGHILRSECYRTDTRQRRRERFARKSVLCSPNQ